MLKNEVVYIFHRNKTKMVPVVQLISGASRQVKCWSLSWRNSVWRCVRVTLFTDGLLQIPTQVLRGI